MNKDLKKPLIMSGIGLAGVALVAYLAFPLFAAPDHEENTNAVFSASSGLTQQDGEGNALLGSGIVSPNMPNEPNEPVQKEEQGIPQNVGVQQSNQSFAAPSSKPNPNNPSSGSNVATIFDTQPGNPALTESNGQQGEGKTVTDRPNSTPKNPTPSSPVTQPTAPTKPGSSDVVLRQVTAADIEAGKQVILNYFKALKQSKTVLLDDYVGYTLSYFRGIGACSVNADNYAAGYIFNDGFKPNFIKFGDEPKNKNVSVETVTRYSNFFATTIYKTLTISVYFDFYGEENWDFIMVKQTETSPWKIDLWSN